MTTTYYSIGGQVLSESTSGARLDYSKDCMKSVIGLIDQTGTMQRTVRYSPYGYKYVNNGPGGESVFGFRGGRSDLNMESTDPGSVVISGKLLYPAFGSIFATNFAGAPISMTFLSGQLGQAVASCGSKAAPWTSIITQPIVDIAYHNVSIPAYCFRGVELLSTVWNLHTEDAIELTDIGIIAQQVNLNITIQNCNTPPYKHTCECLDTWNSNSKNYVETWSVIDGFPPPPVNGQPAWGDNYGWGGKDKNVDCSFSCITGTFAASGSVAYYDGCAAIPGQPAENKPKGAMTWAQGDIDACTTPWRGLIAVNGVPSQFQESFPHKSFSVFFNCCKYPDTTPAYDISASWNGLYSKFSNEDHSPGQFSRTDCTTQKVSSL